MTLISLIELHAQQNPKKNAYVKLDQYGHPIENLSYENLLSTVYILQKSIKNLLSPNEPVIIVSHTNLDFIKVFFGVVSAGCIPIASHVPHQLFWKKSRERLLTILKKTNAKAIFCPAEHKLAIESFLKSESLENKLKIIDFKSVFSAKNNQQQLEQIEHDSTALIQFTSGTTSNPKGVVLTHEQILKNLEAICEQTSLNESCRLVTWLPHSHDMGLIGGLLVPLMAGGTSYILDTAAFIKNPMAWLEAISFNQANCSPSPTFGYDLCSEQFEKNPEKIKNINLASWKVAFNGAEPIRYNSVFRFIKNFSSFGFDEKTMYPCYGLAEASLMVTGSKTRRKVKTLEVNVNTLMDHKIQLYSHSSDQNKNKLTLVSCGQPVKQTEVKIFNFETNKLCDELEVGEIIIAGPSVSNGYFQDTNSTKYFHHKLPLEENCYFKTGDLGFIYENEIYILGRADDTLIIRGEKYHAEEIEQFLANQPISDHLKSITIIGVNSEKQSLQILIEVNSNHLTDNQLTESVSQKIYTILTKSYLLKADIQFIRNGSLIKTTSGKINRHQCKLLWIEKI